MIKAYNDRYVKVDEDVFINMLFDRVAEFEPAKGFSDEFWKDVFDLVADLGWMKNPKDNTPSYIVDNIAVNGEIYEIEEVEKEFADEIKKAGSLDEWLDDNGYFRAGEYIILNLGL